LFLSFGLDREVLRILAVSFESQPPATFSATPGWVEPVLRVSSLAWRTGLRLAFPAIAVLTVADLAMALTGRIHSQLQLLSLAFPVKVLAAVLVLAATLSSFPLLYEHAAKEALQAVRVIAGAGR
jgi:flagellar biosynthetic protein FliR